MEDSHGGAVARGVEGGAPVLEDDAGADEEGAVEGERFELAPFPADVAAESPAMDAWWGGCREG